MQYYLIIFVISFIGVNAMNIQPVPEALPAPLVVLGNGSYYFENNLRVPWSEAYERCRRMNMFLLSIESSEENQLINDHITFVSGLQDYWISGSDLELEGSFKWMSTGQRFSYTYWYPGQPFGLNQNCVLIMYQDGILGWNDENCNGVGRGFICEKICDLCQ